MHLSILVTALVGPDLVGATERGATEQAGASLAPGLEEQALLVVRGRCVALVEDDVVRRLALVPPAHISSATRGQIQAVTVCIGESPDYVLCSSHGAEKMDGTLKAGAGYVHNVRVGRQLQRTDVRAHDAAGPDGDVQRNDLARSSVVSLEKAGVQIDKASQQNLFPLTAGSYHAPIGVNFEMRPELPPRRVVFLMTFDVSCIVKSARMGAPADHRSGRPPLGQALFPNQAAGTRWAYRCSGSDVARPPSWRAHGAWRCVRGAWPSLRLQGGRQLLSKTPQLHSVHTLYSGDLPVDRAGGSSIDYSAVQRLGDETEATAVYCTSTTMNST
eukprot:COSAG02_NODE_1818_length_10774_cov_4.788009_2_plen_330_part_00